MDAATSESMDKEVPYIGEFEDSNSPGYPGANID